jgi:geranylgeranyl diphosphate synthase, type II
MIEKEFSAAIKSEIANLNFPTNPADLYDPLRYIMNLGGKRLRPILTLFGHYLYNDSWKKALRPALSVEVFHNFTLIHDDLMDAAPLRRGQATVHQKWNESTAVLSGDVMLIEAYNLLLSIDANMLPAALARFNKTAAEVCEGQQLDMVFANQAIVTDQDYLEMIRLKTAVLLGFALELGGLMGGADAQEQKVLFEAGTYIGLGFQLDDDILDVYGDPATFGKQIGGDIIENKKTLLLIKALELAEGENLNTLAYWLAKKDADEEKVKEITAVFSTLGIKNTIEALKMAYFQKGVALLNTLNVPQNRKDELLAFLWTLISRNS